jgi:hypothetical protein
MKPESCVPESKETPKMEAKAHPKAYLVAALRQKGKTQDYAPKRERADGANQD